MWSMEYVYGPLEVNELDEFNELDELSEASFGFLDTLSTEEINAMLEQLQDYVDNIVKH